jgi:chromosome segregation ATPase
LKLADKLADIILAEQERSRQLYNKYKELERHSHSLASALEELRKQHRDVHEMLDAAKAEVVTLDGLLHKQMTNEQAQIEMERQVKAAFS